MYAHDYLVQARHDDLMRAAARYRLAAQARRPRAPRRQHVMTAPAWLLAGIRARRIRPVSS
jgi:hypothetical protein